MAKTQNGDSVRAGFFLRAKKLLEKAATSPSPPVPWRKHK